MAQKMTLSGYLAQRGVKAKALTKGEAELLGIPYPLRAGWPRRYGAMEIAGDLLEQLTGCATTARKRSEKNDRENRPNHSSVRSKPRCEASSLVKLQLFPGFVLREARRYRSHMVGAPRVKKARI